MTPQPEPDPRPLKPSQANFPEANPPPVHPDFKGVIPGEQPYKFSVAFSENCDRLFRGEPPSVSEQAITVRAWQAKRLRFLLDENAPTQARELLVLGTSEYVPKERQPPKEIQLPFLVAVPPSPTCPTGALCCGLYSPGKDSFSIGLSSQASESPVKFAALPCSLRLVQGLQWVKLVERLTGSSDIIRADAWTFLDSGVVSPLLGRATGEEVLAEVRSAPLEGVLESLKICRALGISLSGPDLHRGMSHGALPISEDTRAVFEQYEYARNEHRTLSPEILQAEIALKSRKWLGLRYRHSIEALRCEQPTLGQNIRLCAEGVRKFQEVDGENGSSFTRIRSAISGCSHSFQAISRSSYLKGINEGMWERLRTIGPLFANVDTQLYQLASPSDGNFSRREILSSMNALLLLDSSVLQLARELRPLFRAAYCDVEHESGADRLEECYEYAARALVCTRRELDRCFPGWLQYGSPLSAGSLEDSDPTIV